MNQVELELAELERSFREREFKVKVSREERGLYPDEIRVSITHNEFRWNSLLMNEAEARMICQAIADHFGWENPWCRNTERRGLPFPNICPYTSCQRTFTTKGDLWVHVKEHLRKENAEHEL